MPGIDVPQEACEASEQENQVNPVGDQEMQIEGVDKIVENVMRSEGELSPDATVNKDKSVKLAQEESRGFIAALKENPKIAGIATSPKFLQALSVTAMITSILLAQSAEDFHQQAGNILDNFDMDPDRLLSYGISNRDQSDTIPGFLESFDGMAASVAGSAVSAAIGLWAGGKSIFNFIKNQKEKK
ncbi:MAG: hypothetical protein MUD10_01875 [Candidatus Pacebacteria bacterium]|nr:hypothetical protein [Candidatus Paceibacterota bacterium]